jgi:hypothetical protein
MHFVMALVKQLKPGNYLTSPLSLHIHINLTAQQKITNVVHLESVVTNYISCTIIFNHRMHSVHVYPCLLICEIVPFVLPFWRSFSLLEVVCFFWCLGYPKWWTWERYLSTPGYVWSIILLNSCPFHHFWCSMSLLLLSSIPYFLVGYLVCHIYCRCFWHA